MDETDAHAPRRTDGTLVATSVVIAAVDLLYLGVAVTFGPSGFGGDSDRSGSEVAAANAGQAAGLFGCLLAAGAIGAFALMGPRPGRRRVLTWILVAQLLASVVLVATS